MNIAIPLFDAMRTAIIGWFPKLYIVELIDVENVLFEP
jgi:hypothetical protein